jgi:hypothetical protein
MKNLTQGRFQGMDSGHSCQWQLAFFISSESDSKYRRHGMIIADQMFLKECRRHDMIRGKQIIENR